jgi:hypothetical protein
MPKTELKPIFFPAIAHASSQDFNMTDKELLNTSTNVIKNIRFYNEGDNYFYHPYSLWNAHEHLLHQRIGKNELRKKKNIDKKCYVMLDSGGFQLGRGKDEDVEKYNAKIVLPWSESNGDMFPIIDYPLVNEYNRTFDDSLKFTVRNGEYYKKHRKKKGIRILNVIQGRELDEIDAWFDGVKHLNKGKGGLDGWAIGGQSKNPCGYIYAIRKLYKAGEFSKNKMSWVHVFGTTSFENMLYLSVIQKCLNKLTNNGVQVSYDSATQCHTAKFGKLMDAQPNLSRFIKDGGDLPVVFSDLCESIDKFRYIHLSKNFNQKFVKKDTPLPFPYSPITAGITDSKEFCDGNFVIKKNKNGKSVRLSTKQRRLKVAHFLLGVNHNLWMIIQQKELFDNLVFWQDEQVINNSIGNELKINVNVIKEIFTKKELRKVYTMKRENILEAFNTRLKKKFFGSSNLFQERI